MSTAKMSCIGAISNTYKRFTPTYQLIKPSINTFVVLSLNNKNAVSGEITFVC